jgi:hypothetical protein
MKIDAEEMEDKVDREDHQRKLIVTALKRTRT